MRTCAEQFGEFVERLSFEGIPKEVVQNIKLRFLDILGIALASSKMDFARMVVDTIKE